MTLVQMKTKILMFLLYLLPFADIINGYMIKKIDFSGVGKIFHLVLLIVLVCCIFFNNKISIGKYEKCTFLLILVFIISGFVNGNYQSISLERVGKIISTAITFVCLIALKQKDIISNEKFDKLLNYICIVNIK